MRWTSKHCQAPPTAAAGAGPQQLFQGEVVKGEMKEEAEGIGTGHRDDALEPAQNASVDATMTLLSAGSPRRQRLTSSSSANWRRSSAATLPVMHESRVCAASCPASPRLFLACRKCMWRMRTSGVLSSPARAAGSAAPSGCRRSGGESALRPAPGRARPAVHPGAKASTSSACRVPRPIPAEGGSET